MDLNKVMIGGRLGANPELRTTASGRPVCNFRVATNERFKKANGDKVERTTWHSMVAWGSQAETIAKYFTKGDQILIEGRLQTTSWKDKDSGEDRYRQEVVVEKMHFVGGGKKIDAPAASAGDAPELPFDNAADIGEEVPA